MTSLSNYPTKMQPDNFYNSKFFKKNKVLYRDYQVNIVETCKQTNSLVVLPTALGKTIIAMMQCAIHLEKYQGSKILILAPTKPLVSQHFRTFTKFLTDEINMDTIIGGIPPMKRALKVNNSQIIFTTPQIVKNDVLNGSYDLKDFSLIVFDEAHKARKSYAYTFIAEEYMFTGKKPYILALTASPGKDKIIINELIQKLFIEQVCFKNGDNIDVKEYIHPIEMLIESIDLPMEVIEVHAVLRSQIEETIDFFKGKNVLPIKNYYSKVDFIRLNHDIRAFDLYHDEYYEYNYPNIHKVLEKNQKNKFAFISMAISGIYLLHLEELLTTQNPQLFINYIEKLKERAKLGSKSALRIIDGKFFKDFIKLMIPKLEISISPKIETILKLLNYTFKDNPKSKVIIFTQFRDMATILTDKIQDMNNKYIKPIRFVGQSSKIGDKGLTQKTQQEIIQAFENGEYSILIATSIAEEGLDIPNVEAVIFYEPVPSEIRLIQRRGRTGRHSKGLCYILSARDTLDEVYLKVSFNKEKKMNDILISQDDLEIMTDINRTHDEFIPDEKTDLDIIKFFKDADEKKKFKSEKAIEMIGKIQEMESEQNRVDLINNYGCNDITRELEDLALQRLNNIEDNRKKIKENNKEDYYKRQREKRAKKYEEMKAKRKN